MSNTIKELDGLPGPGLTEMVGADIREPRDGLAASSLHIIAADGHATPRNCSLPQKAEVTNSGAPTSDGALSVYRVGFYNQTSDSTGNEHHVCQRQLEVTASGEAQAVARAVAEFEKREEVLTWRDRADSIECTPAGGER